MTTLTDKIERLRRCESAVIRAAVTWATSLNDDRDWPEGLILRRAVSDLLAARVALPGGGSMEQEPSR